MKVGLRDFKLGSGWRPAGLAVLFVAAVLLSGFGGAWIEHNLYKDDLADAKLGQSKKIVSNQSRLISQIAKSVGPSVVSINVDISGTSRDFFGFAAPESERAAGTGIIISDDGYVVTNRHVVPEGTTRVSVTLSDGSELKDVSVVDRTSQNDSLDVAFLKINNTQGHDLKAAELGDSSKVQVGDDVVAIGNALGQFQNTVTSGIISGFGRSVQAAGGDGSSAENLDNLFQTDAAINEGNSGGPLVNLNGQVIGINTAVAGNAQSIGFAIPINDVRGLIEQVLQKGSFARPYLGVRYISLTADLAKQFKLSVDEGAFIAPADDRFSNSVQPGGPADKAGLKQNDVITAVDNKKVDQSHSLTSRLSPHKPGDRVTLTVVRGNKTLHITVRLGSRPSD